MLEPIVKTDMELLNILNRITFVNTVLDFKWKFNAQSFVHDTVTPHKQGWLVWVTFERPDTITGTIGIGRGRDEIIWRGTTLSGVVKTLWVLVEMIVKHELMEGFRFDNQRIFNPHNSVVDLANLQITIDGREVS